MNRVLPRVESDQIIIDFVLPPSGELSFVVRFEGDNVEPSIMNRNGSRILSWNLKTLCHFAICNVDDRDLILRRQRHICFIVVCEGDTDRFIKRGRL